MKKVRPESKLKTLPDEAQEELWQLLNEIPEDRERPMTYTEARVWLLESRGLETSQAALSEWYAWYGFRLRTERAKARAGQAQIEAAEIDPSLDPESLDRIGQMVFTAETLEERNVKYFIELLKLKGEKEDREIKREALQLDRQKLEAATKSKIEAGLDALAETIRGNAAAEKIYRELKKVLAER